ncbi:DNA-binding protein [Streptomyces sp. NBC_01352]|uniref:DNA-binding protein n=1 Tax=Streptomyces sp. NBC_01352 TaxID=2903834 RepID=UPI002E340FC0|nr:DNA-binding protein [Streptomyces sp. NBC_01352]
MATETTSSLICRIASLYGMEAKALRSCWHWRNYPPGHDGGGARADAEVLLNAAGRQLLAGLCGVEEDVLARALPSWGQEDAKLPAGQDAGPAAAWRIGGALAGPVTFGCRLCTARRTGTAVRVVRYAQRWQRVCVRHGWWLLDADADQPLEHLDLRGVPEVAAAQRRWTGVARRALRAGAQPERVFALAHAVVARWWEQTLVWQQETIWPHRLHQVAGGNAGKDLERWRIVGRDAAIFPEVMAVADALLDPAMAQLAWIDSGALKPRPLPADGMFCRRLGERVDRPWLGPLAATDYGSPLTNWMGAVIRLRRGEGGPPGYDNDPWWLRQEHQPATIAGQLRLLGKEKKTPGSARTWRAAVPAEQRALITRAIESAEEQLIQLRGAQYGKTADAAQQLLRNLGHAATLIDQALRESAAAALTAGMALEDLAQWARLPADVLADVLVADHNEWPAVERWV